MVTETSRLKLRRLTADDAGFVLELTNEPSFLSNIGDKGLRNREDAKRFIQAGPWTCQAKDGYGQFLLELKSTGASIGICGLLYRDFLDVTDVGFALLPRYWGHGYAVEAAEAVVDYGTSSLGVEKIVALTTQENLASIRVLKKLGMEFQKMVAMDDDDPGTALYS